MVFISGSRTRYVLRGYVADTCPSCHEPCRFSVLSHYRSTHVFYIPVGGESVVATTQRCASCGGDFPYDPRRFSAILAPDMQGSMQELMRRTNPALAETVGVGAYTETESTLPSGFASPPPATSLSWAQLAVAAALIVGAGVVTVPYIWRESAPPPAMPAAPQPEDEYPITVENIRPGTPRSEYSANHAKGLKIQEVNGRAGVVSGESIERDGAPVAHAGDSIDKVKRVLGNPDSVEPGVFFSRLYYRRLHLYVSCKGQTVASFTLVPTLGR